MSSGHHSVGGRSYVLAIPHQSLRWDVQAERRLYPPRRVKRAHRPTRSLQAMIEATPELRKISRFELTLRGAITTSTDRTAITSASRCAAASLRPALRSTGLAPAFELPPQRWA